jgi:hypothetical protein
MKNFYRLAHHGWYQLLAIASAAGWAGVNHIAFAAVAKVAVAVAGIQPLDVPPGRDRQRVDLSVSRSELKEEIRTPGAGNSKRGLSRHLAALANSISLAQSSTTEVYP